MKKSIYNIYVKRFLDIILSLSALILLSPLLIIIAVLVYFKLGKPVIFKQARPGKNEKIFKMLKFRTMKNIKDENGELLPDSQRLSTFGKKLRSTSLDELPELWNILKGDMSFIGPRPLLVKYLPLYNEEQRKRHLVRPGLTGYAQVNGRNSLSWEKKFQYDVDYVSNVSFLTDVEIFFKTIIVALRRENISSGSHETMSEFLGESDER